MTEVCVHSVCGSVSQDSTFEWCLCLLPVRTMHRGRTELLSEEGRRNGDDNNRSGGGHPLRSVYADALELHGSDGGRTEVGGK